MKVMKIGVSQNYKKQNFGAKVPTDIPDKDLLVGAIAKITKIGSRSNADRVLSDLYKLYPDGGNHVEALLNAADYYYPPAVPTLRRFFNVPEPQVRPYSDLIDMCVPQPQARPYSDLIDM